MASPESFTLPGAVDLHVHLREPGRNKAETIASGTWAALLGGFVLVADMPNNPGYETWTEYRVDEKHAIVDSYAHIPTATYAGSQPNSDNIGELAKMAPKCIGLKLYGSPTTGNDRDYSADEFRDIVEEWHRVAPDKPIMFHAGENNLERMIYEVAKDLNHHLHVCHVNDPQQVEQVKWAKKQRLPVTCGVTPHHLFKTSHNVVSEGWFARMQPPLASQIDSEKLFHQLVYGDIDVVETDHAPHTFVSKMHAEEQNPDGIHDPEHATCFGVPGIEFALPLLFYQNRRGKIGMERIVEVTSTKPAEILGTHLNKETDVTWLMDEYRIEDERTQVKSIAGWTPFLGMMAVGIRKSTRINGSQIKSALPGNREGRAISRRGERI